jgi:hypothetical protein
VAVIRLKGVHFPSNEINKQSHLSASLQQLAVHLRSVIAIKVEAEVIYYKQQSPCSRQSTRYPAVKFTSTACSIRWPISWTSGGMTSGAWHCNPPSRGSIATLVSLDPDDKTVRIVTKRVLRFPTPSPPLVTPDSVKADAVADRKVAQIQPVTYPSQPAFLGMFTRLNFFYRWKRIKVNQTWQVLIHTPFKFQVR